MYPRHREENISTPPPPPPFNYSLIYVKQIYVPVWGPIYISQLFSKILDKLCGKSRPPPTYQIKDKKMVRFGRTRAVWESQAGCHFSTNAQRACTLRTSFYSIFYVPPLSCIWSQSVLIVSLPLCFPCDTETSSRDVD